MLAKQLSIFIENKEGHLARITHTIKDAGIDLRALSVFDSAEFGILRIIVNDPYKAADILKEEGHVVKMTDVLAVEPEDKVGAMNAIFTVLADNGFNVEYVYFNIQRGEHAMPQVILKTNDQEKAMALLAGAGVIVNEA